MCENVWCRLRGADGQVRRANESEREGAECGAGQQLAEGEAELHPPTGVQ